MLIPLNFRVVIMWSKLSLFCRNTCTQLCHILAEMNMIVGMLLGTVYSKGFIDNFLKCGELESYGLRDNDISSYKPGS